MKENDYKRALKLLKPFYSAFALDLDEFNIAISEGSIYLSDKDGNVISEINPLDREFLNNVFESLDITNPILNVLQTIVLYKIVTSSKVKKGKKMDMLELGKENAYDYVLNLFIDAKVISKKDLKELEDTVLASINLK